MRYGPEQIHVEASVPKMPPTYDVELSLDLFLEFLVEIRSKCTQVREI